MNKVVLEYQRRKQALDALTPEKMAYYQAMKQDCSSNSDSLWMKGTPDDREICNWLWDFENHQDYDTVAIMSTGEISANQLFDLMIGHLRGFAQDVANGIEKLDRINQEAAILIHDFLCKEPGPITRQQAMALELASTVIGNLVGDDEENYFEVSDDGADYLMAAMDNLGWLASMVKEDGVLDLERFNRYCSIDEEEFPEGGCDGEPRICLRWVYWTYCFNNLDETQGTWYSRFQED